MTILQRVYKFFSKPSFEEGIVDLYKNCVVQARSPAFYLAGVPDTVDGRFDLILLHVYLVMRRLHAYKEENQQLFDLMFGDMDRSLREMGVGDMSIRKKMRPMISAFYGRAQAYQVAINDKDIVLAATLKRNLYGNILVEDVYIQRLTDYVRKIILVLDNQHELSLLSGKVEFVEPALSGEIL